MAKKTSRKRRKPDTLDAISGTDAIQILRILADRDRKLSQEIDVIARDLLAEVSMDEVADCVQAELESLAVEDVWDRSGRRRDGYVDTGDTAWSMFEDALKPFREEMAKYQRLSMPKQAEAMCLGITLDLIFVPGMKGRGPQKKDFNVTMPRHCPFFLRNWIGR